MTIEIPSDSSNFWIWTGTLINDMNVSQNRKLLFMWSFQVDTQELNLRWEAGSHDFYMSYQPRTLSDLSKMLQREKSSLGDVKVGDQVLSPILQVLWNNKKWLASKTTELTFGL